MSKIKPEELSTAIMKQLLEYKEDIDEEVIETTDSVVKEVIQELKETSPQGKGSRAKPYYRGWSPKVNKKTGQTYTKVIWNKTNYQLTHLLEFGHATRNGGRTRAFPHIRPVEEKYSTKFMEKLFKKIRRVSKWH